MRYADCHTDRKHYCHGLCLACYRRARYSADPEKRKAWEKRWRAKNLEKERERCRLKEAATPRSVKSDRHRRRRYGLQPGEFQRMMDRQDGLCLICRKPKRRLNVDHCHKTGTVRGLLCSPCNAFVGIAEADDLFLFRFCDYVITARDIREAS